MGGSSNWQSTGVVVYNPSVDYLTAGQEISDSFTYRVHDGVDYSNVGTVSITITGVADPLYWNDSTSPLVITMDEDSSSVFYYPATDLDARISNIDIEGTVATVRLEADKWTGNRFTDFFTLLKLDGNWLIMNKVFHLHS